jgi:hypothetical protein
VGPPTPWIVSRVCEEFGCAPSVALEELERNEALVFDVMELRAYARGKQVYDALGSMSDAERRRAQADRIVQLVTETDFALQRQRMNHAG